ncbi:hypothetical protein E2C01_059581 [Portunus trituberculatus]|uniref:Uncharacterized protein n=1 Tax=Portunus trituberculatus TaxID=210409 RepID=A0A5B7H862_PORTR|nr:hypothetical protein [Portunus trituberculatus]
MVTCERISNCLEILGDIAALPRWFRYVKCVEAVWRGAARRGTDQETRQRGRGAEGCWEVMFESRLKVGRI